MKMRILSLMILSYLIYDYSWPGSCGLCPPLSSLPVLVFGERTKDVFLYHTVWFSLTQMELYTCLLRSTSL